MKKLSKHIKRALILTALSYASVCILPNTVCEMMSVCNANKVSMSDEERFQALQQSAIEGDAKAQYELGNCYYYGIFIEKDYGKASYWYLKAAKQDDVKAQITLAECYDWRGVFARDDNLAIYWYTKAAEQNNIEAQYRSTISIS